MRPRPSPDRSAIGADVTRVEQVPVPEVRSFPRDDAQFRAHVEAAIDLGQIAHGGVEAPLDTIKDRLRGQYPLVAVHAQDPLAVFPGQRAVVYAYRDGRVNPVAPARKIPRPVEDSVALPGIGLAVHELGAGAEASGADRAQQHAHGPAPHALGFGRDRDRL